MFENVDGRTDDGRTTDAGVIGILIAHLGAFGSGELKIQENFKLSCEYFWKHYGKWSIRPMEPMLHFP